MEQPPGKPISRPSIIPTINTSKRVGTGGWDFQPTSKVYHAQSDISIFSSSLPVLHGKVTINDQERDHEPIDAAPHNLSKLHQDVEEDSFEDIANQTIGYLLPDNEDELLAGIIDYDLSALPSQLEESEETDLFESLGGMELDSDAQESLSMGIAKVNLSDGAVANGMIAYGLPNSVGAVAGEHPLGEHPSRTLFVRNINSNVEDSELKILFEGHAVSSVFHRIWHIITQS